MPDPSDIRREQIEDNLRKDLELLEEWEDELRLARNPTERKRCEAEIERLEQSIADRTAELNRLGQAPRESHVLRVQAGGDLAVDEELLAKNWSFQIGPWEDYSHSLAIHVSASFTSLVFNTEPYLRSIDNLELISPQQGFDCSIRTLSITNSANWTVFLKFKEKPDPSLTLKFASGPRRWALEVGPMEWKQYQSETFHSKTMTWWGAQGSLHLTLEDPNWIILRSARLLPLKKPNSSLLEVIVENRSQVAIPLNQLTLKASHDWGVRCGAPEPPNLWQKLSLDWPQILSTSPIEAAEGAWTVLNDEGVNVHCGFKEANCGDYDHRFSAEVPLQIDLKPNTITRVSVEVAEIRLSHGQEALIGFGRLPPGSLREWDNLSVSLDPNEAIYPRAVKISRSDNP